MEDYNEDERENNEEKEIEESENDSEESEDEKEERFFSLLANLDTSIVGNNTSVTSFFIEGVSICSLEIQLPPPEYTI